MSRIELDHVSFGYGATPVLRDISARVDQAQLIAVIGPNGAGKSTLIRVLAGLLAPTTGACSVEGQPLRQLDRRTISRSVAHVPQQITAAVPFTVEEVILTGRTPHSHGLFESAEDLRAVEAAIALTHLDTFRDRPFLTLSGGEQQRVLLAAAIAQDAPIFLLDEPGAHLDPQNQTELWNLLAQLREQGRAVLIVTHHLNLAAERADRVWVLHDGRLVCDAAPDEAMRPERLQPVFHVPFYRHAAADGRVYLTYG